MHRSQNINIMLLLFMEKKIWAQRYILIKHKKRGKTYD